MNEAPPVDAAPKGMASRTALPFWRHNLVLIPAFGVLAALALSLRIVERGEIWLDRTWWLTGFAALSGLVGAAATRLIQGMLKWQMLRSWPRTSAAVLFATVFMAAMTIAYLVHFLGITGQLEPRESRPIWAWFWIISEVSALFLISSPTYMLPWPLPLLMLAAAWFLSGKSPDEPENREEPGKDTQAG